MNKGDYERWNAATNSARTCFRGYSASVMYIDDIFAPPRTELELARMHVRFLADENYRLKRENERLKEMLYD